MSRSEHEILSDVKKLAIEYYGLTGKPLGVTGEIAVVEDRQNKLRSSSTPGMEVMSSLYGDARRGSLGSRKANFL